MRKKLWLMAVLALFAAVTAAAQATITTKKYKISDFTAKTLKVVLPGSDWMDALLREEVQHSWTLSPYEFCTVAEFDALHASDQYYFLMIVSGRFRKEKAPGIDMLTVLKGGDEDIDRLLEVVSLPFGPDEDMSGRESIFLGPLLRIAQRRVELAMESDLKGYLGIPSTIVLGRESRHKTILFADSDISIGVTEIDRMKYFDENIRMVDEDEADEAMAGREAMTLVSYVVAPENPVNGSYCYKMLFDAESGDLVYFRRHKISSRRPAGFLTEDLKRIVAVR
ncbi:MAG: hypothetical protein LIQ26_05945 [Bacteroidota bacterium]|nr:hypothetical protein [Bacteroidota bacterium]